MELTLNIYKKKSKYRLSDEVERVAKLQDFELSTGVCEDVIDSLHIDLLADGLTALSTESQQELFFGIVKDGYPFFVELIKDIFEITDDEARRLKISEVFEVVIKVAKYSLSQLGKSVNFKNIGNSKN